MFQRTDVTSEADIKAAVDRAVKEFGRLDIMFNNAGVAGAVGPIEKVASADFDKTIAVLLRAAFLGMKYSIPEMRKAGGGFDHLDRVGRGTARGRLSLRIQRGQGRGGEPYAGGRDRSRA